MTEEDVQMPDRCERAGGQLVAAGATDRWFENPTWGCRRITVMGSHGLVHALPSTVWLLLNRARMDPAPCRAVRV
jgi:hypothetical protein